MQICAHDRRRSQCKESTGSSVWHQMFQKRGPAERAVLIRTCTGYMYMMVGLGRLPDFEGVGWQGYNHGSKKDILRT